MSSKGHSRETRSGGGARHKTTRKSSVSQNDRKSRNPPAATATSENELRNSKYQALQNACKYCANPCGDFNDPLSVQCTICKAWSHTGCESQDIEIVNELKKAKTFLCTECKETCKSDMSAESSMESDSRYGEQDDLDPEDPDQTCVMQLVQVNNQNKPSYSQGESTLRITSVESNATLLNSGESAYPTDQVAKTEKINHDSQIGAKMDQIMDMMGQVKQDINRIDKKTNLLEAKNDAFLTSTAFKLKEQCKASIDDAFDKLDVSKKIDKSIDQKINQGIAKQMDKVVETKIDQALTKKMDQKIDAKLKDVTHQIDQKINSNFTLGLKNRVEEIVDHRMDKAIDDLEDRLWRKRNIMIVNLPESTSRNIDTRMEDDLSETLRLLNSFMTVYDNQIDGFPARIGKVGNKPRMLRVTLYSERLVKTIVGMARDNSDILNPNEHNNAKKIYINRDFSSTDREIRKRLYAEKKDKEKRGEKGWAIRKNKLVKLDDAKQFTRPYNRPQTSARQSDERQVSLKQLDRNQDRPVGNDRQDEEFGRSPLNRKSPPSYSQKVIEGAVGGQNNDNRHRSNSFSRSHDEYDFDRYSRRDRGRYYTPKAGYNSNPAYRKERPYSRRSRSGDRLPCNEDRDRDFGIFD